MGQRLLVVDSDRSFLKEHQVSLEAAFDVDVSMAPDGALPKLEGGGYAAALICVEVAENKGYALRVGRLNVRKRTGEPDSYDVEVGVSAWDRSEPTPSAGAAPSASPDKEKKP